MPALPGVLGMLASGSPKAQEKQPPGVTPVKTKSQTKAAASKTTQDAAAEGKIQQKQVKDAKNSEEARKRAAELLEANAGKFEAAPTESEEPSDAAEEEDTTWDPELRRQLAESAWCSAAAGTATGLASPTLVPEAAKGQLEFRALAALLQEVAGGGPALVLRTLTNFLRQLMCSTPGEDCRHANLSAALGVMLNTPGRVPHRQLAQSVGAAFGLKKEAAALIGEEDIVEASLLARRKQQVLAFRRQSLRAADVAAALEEDLSPGTQQDRLTKVLGNSTAEGRETCELVRALQGSTGFSWDIALRAFAQAAVLSPPGAPAPTWADDEARSRALVAMEDAVQRAYAQDGRQTGRLIDAVLAGVAPDALPARCLPRVGVPVLPMRLMMDRALDPPGALQKFDGPVLAEWNMNGERAQVHVEEKGNKVHVFVGAECRPLPERVEDAAMAFKGQLKDVESCILEVIFCKGRKGKEDQKDSRETRVMMAFDMLALNGKPLVELPLRERREALRASIVESKALRLVRSSEVAAGEGAAAEVAKQLDEALQAAYLAEDPLEKACGKTMGLVLKSLDASYSAGRCHSAWLGLEKPPVTGPEADQLLFDTLSEDERTHLPAKEEFHFTVISGFRTRSEEGIQDILKIQQLYRAGGVDPTWYVDNECPDEYRRLGLKVVKAGKLIPARNHALVDANALNKVCVQTSDDIGCWQFINDSKRYLADDEANAAFKSAQKFNVTPVAAAQYLLAKMRSRGDKCRLGGVYCLSNGGRAMRATPFGLQNFILGDFFVAEVSDCRFDEKLSLKEDYDFTCSHLKAHGEAYRCNRMLITAKHETNAGGACAVRDAEGVKERYNIGILKEKWPGVIRDHQTRANQIIMRWDWVSQDGDAAKKKREREEPAKETKDVKGSKKSKGGQAMEEDKKAAGKAAARGEDRKAAAKVEAKAKAKGAKRKASSDGATGAAEDKEGAGAKKSHRKQEPDEEEEKLVRSQIYEMQEASPEEKAMIPAVIVGFAKFMDGKVSASSVVTYSHQVRRELMMRLRSLKAAASDEYRALVQRTKYDVRSNRTTSCGISWFSRFYRDVCEQHSGEFKVDPAWDEEAEAARKTRTEFFVDEAGRDVRTGGKGNFSSKYVGVSFNKHVKKWVAVSRQGNKFIGHYATEEVAAEARAAEANGRPLPTPERSIFNMLGATAAAKPVVPSSGLFSKPAKDSEVEETVEVVPITDPISLMRIETPVRGKNCCHKAVFDRDAYLEFNAMQEKRKFKSLKDLWLCPICSKPTPESSLVVVEELAEVLKSAKKKPDLEHVLAMPDGTFSLVE